jgi:hypothetical protein
MSVVPGMNESSAQVLRTISMAVANSLLCDIGGFQTPTEGSSERCVEPHKSTGVECRLLALSPLSICDYRCWLMPEVEEGKLEMFAGSKYIVGDT